MAEQKISRLLRGLVVLAILLLAGLAPASTVRDVRVAPHDTYTRAVVELDSTSPFTVENRSSRDRTVLLRVMGADGSSDGWRTPPDGSFVRGMRLTKSSSAAVIELRTDRNVRLAWFTLQNPPRVVVDFYREGITPSLPADATGGYVEPAPTSAFSAPSPAPYTPPAPTAAPYVPAPRVASSGWKRIIIVDPGHGGYHKGALGKLRGREVYEKQCTIQVAERLEKLLKADPRFDVKLTRREDVYVGLQERTDRASRMSGDLFISLHCNAVPIASAASRARGFEIWTWNQDGNVPASAKAMERIENEEPGIARDNNAIIGNMMQDALESQALASRRFAAAVERSSIRHPYIKANNRGIHSARFKVLEVYDMPSILVEMGFMSHPEEVKMLFDASYQQSLAKAFYEGIVGYYEANDPTFPGGGTRLVSR